MHTLIIITSALLLIITSLAIFFYLKFKSANENLLKQTKINELQKTAVEQVNLQLNDSKSESEKLSQFKSKFLANISHEIRTPLNAISGYTKLLANSLNEECDKYYLNQVGQAADNMNIIINDLVDYSSIEAGKMVIEEIRFNLVKIVTQAISTLKFKAEEKNIKLEIHIDPFIPPTLIGDPHRLSQILTNLMSNAIKFSSDSQVVTIEATCNTQDDACNMHFIITDHGFGIPENKLITIFESFTQVHKDTARFYKGTGLGLSIVKRLIELQNGTITVKSKVNHGSMFSFTIPYKIAPEIPVDNSDSANVSLKEGNLTKKHILLVEDNAINRELVIDTIETWAEPFEVDFAENGKEALLAIQKKQYDVILMDIQMPIMDGHETTQYIRQSLPLPKCNIPIIGMTAHALLSEKELALKNGMNEYLTKPFNPDELKQKILYFVNN